MTIILKCGFDAQSFPKTRPSLPADKPTANKKNKGVQFGQNVLFPLLCPLTLTKPNMHSNLQHNVVMNGVSALFTFSEIKGVLMLSADYQGHLSHFLCLQTFPPQVMTSAPFFQHINIYFADHRFSYSDRKLKKVVLLKFRIQEGLCV